MLHTFWSTLTCSSQLGSHLEYWIIPYDVIKTMLFKLGAYSMFHVSWITFKFNRNQLETVLAYVMWLWLIALLMCTLKWLSSIEIPCHKGFHLKPKAAINYTEISSLICDVSVNSNLVHPPGNPWDYLKRNARGFGIWLFKIAWGPGIRQMW